MRTYTFTKDLTSYKVDKELINRIEDYLFEDVARKVLKVEPKLIEKYYQIKIKDSFGTATYSNISLYKQPFPNDIKEIQLSLRKGDSNCLKLEINFNESWQNCKIEMEIESENSESDIYVIWRNIEKILGSNKTYNSIFYGKNYVGIYFFFTGSILMLMGLIFDSILCFIAVTLIIIWYTVGTYLYPYTDFDCKKNKIKRNLRTWFLSGLCGLVLGLFFNEIVDKLKLLIK